MCVKGKSDDRCSKVLWMTGASSMKAKIFIRDSIVNLFSFLILVGGVLGLAKGVTGAIVLSVGYNVMVQWIGKGEN